MKRLFAILIFPGHSLAAIPEGQILFRNVCQDQLELNSGPEFTAITYFYKTSMDKPNIFFSSRQYVSAWEI